MRSGSIRNELIPEVVSQACILSRPPGSRIQPSTLTPMDYNVGGTDGDRAAAEGPWKNVLDSWQIGTHAVKKAYQLPARFP